MCLSAPHVGILSLYQTSAERESLTRTFARNEVPLQYFLLLLAQFCLILVDRVIYLRRHITAKFWFQVAERKKMKKKSPPPI